MNPDNPNLRTDEQIAREEKYVAEIEQLNERVRSLTRSGEFYIKEIELFKSKLKVALQGLCDAPTHVCGCCQDSLDAVVKHCLAVGNEVEKI